MPLARREDGLLRGELNGGHFDNYLQPCVLELVAESLPCPRIGEGFEVQQFEKKKISDFPPLESLQLPGPLRSILISILISAIRVGITKVFQFGLGIINLDKTFLLLMGAQDLGVKFLPAPILQSFTNKSGLASGFVIFGGSWRAAEEGPYSSMAGGKSKRF